MAVGTMIFYTASCDSHTDQLQLQCCVPHPLTQPEQGLNAKALTTHSASFTCPRVLLAQCSMLSRLCATVS